jgi:hypothetical protein
LGIRTRNPRRGWRSHDLSVFARTLREEPQCFDKRGNQQVLLGLIAQRQEALRALARPLGKRPYAEPPSAFCRRLHRYWQVWRDRHDRHGAAELAEEAPAVEAAASAG